jgi:hypothetical protein
MEDEFRVGQLTKELVALKLKELQNPCAVAAGLVRQTITVALKARPEEAEKVVIEACYGGMQGLLLADQDLACGAVLIMGAVCEGAGDVGGDPTALMMFALTGIARFTKFIEHEKIVDISHSLEKRYQGVGVAFSEALSREAEVQKTPTV